MPRLKGRMTGAALAALALLVLGACFMSPGKFVSTLDIRADRSFTFAYKGEVIVTDMDDMSKGLGTDDGAGDETDGDTDAPEEEQTSAYYQQIAFAGHDMESTTGAAAPVPADTLADEPESEEKRARMQEIADALSKEEGYRSVRYMGKNKFEIDYQISGRLDHSFLFPFNVDARAAFPFLVIEVRKDGKVRVQAPSFAENADSRAAAGGMGAGKGTPEREGSFTLTTNAEIVSQNQEDGATSTPQGKQIVWKITPYTRIAPMAVLKMAAGK